MVTTRKNGGLARERQLLENVVVVLPLVLCCWENIGLL